MKYKTMVNAILRKVCDDQELHSWDSKFSEYPFGNDREAEYYNLITRIESELQEKGYFYFTEDGALVPTLKAHVYLEENGT